MLAITKVKMKTNRSNVYLFTVNLIAIILIMAGAAGQYNTLIFSPALAQSQVPPSQNTFQIPPNQQQQQPTSGGDNNDTITSIVTLTDLNTGETQTSPESSPRQVSQMVQSELNTDQSLTPTEKSEASSLSQTLLAESQDMVQKLSETTISEPSEQDKVVIVTEACTGSVCMKSITSKGDIISGNNVDEQYTAQGSSALADNPSPAPAQ
jgi:hypothetical protein